MVAPRVRTLVLSLLHWQDHHSHRVQYAHEDAGNSTFADTVHYKHFRAAWYAYLSLLDIDFSSGFQCTTCGPYPQTIIMDATSLSFRKDLDFWKKEMLTEISDIKVPKGRYITFFTFSYVCLSCTSCVFLIESLWLILKYDSNYWHMLERELMIN